VSGRVLVVTYYFPPLGGVGVQRTSQYITYLPHWAAGWPPHPAYTDPRRVASTFWRPIWRSIAPPAWEPGQLHNP